MLAMTKPFILIQSEVFFPMLLGYIVLGEVPEEVIQMVDQLERDDIPENYRWFWDQWSNRNDAPEDRADVIDYFQRLIKGALP